MPTIDVNKKEIVYIHLNKMWTPEKPFTHISENYISAPIKVPKKWKLGMVRFDLPIRRIPLHDSFITSAGSFLNINSGNTIHFNVEFNVGAASHKIMSVGQLMNDFSFICKEFFTTHNLSIIFELSDSGCLRIRSEPNNNDNTFWNQNWVVQLSLEMSFLLKYVDFLSNRMLK